MNYREAKARGLGGARAVVLLAPFGLLFWVVLGVLVLAALRASSDEETMTIDQSIEVEVIKTEGDGEEPKYGREVVDREIDFFCEEQRELGQRLPKLCKEEE